MPVAAPHEAFHRDHAALLPAFAAVMDSIGVAPARVAVAVSGGADSMALALLAREHGLTVTALTVNHGLRPEAAAEAQQVNAWMQARGIAHHTLTPAAQPIANLQARAREMRYGAMLQWCRDHGIAWLLLGHHADDQAETVALQRHRGDSPPSRAGMALVARREGVQLLRPLLGMRPYLLRNFLQAQGQAWIEDPSNNDARFARTRMRQRLSDTDIATLWHEAQQQGAQRHADDVARAAWVAAHAAPAGDGLRLAHPAWAALADAARTDLLSRAVQAVGGKAHRPRHHETLRLDAALRSAPTGTATLGHCLVRWGDGQVVLQPEHAGLDSRVRAPHITRPEPLKALANAPFWWFSQPLIT